MAPRSTRPSAAGMRGGGQQLQLQRSSSVPPPARGARAGAGAGAVSARTAATGAGPTPRAGSGAVAAGSSSSSAGAGTGEGAGATSPSGAPSLSGMTRGDILTAKTPFLTQKLVAGIAALGNRVAEDAPHHLYAVRQLDDIAAEVRARYVSSNISSQLTCNPSCRSLQGGANLPH
jgi:hypothetical protein